MQLLDGKKVSSAISQKLQTEVELLKAKGIHPHLTIILVGDDPASLSYIKAKRKASEVIGVETNFLRFQPDEMTTEKLIETIHQLNKDSKVTGILVQLPLPSHLSAPEIIKAIDPQKDVDGFTAYNLGKMFISKEFEHLAPCTPLGVIRILEHYNISVEGKEVVMVGASNLVGKPLAAMLINRRATVTVCHSKTKNLASHTRRAEVLIVAVGKAGLITSEMVRDNAIVIDVGVNRTADGKLVGDVDFEEVSKKVSAITPVPGGCGPMTVMCLMENMVKAAKKQHNL